MTEENTANNFKASAQFYKYIFVCLIFFFLNDTKPFLQEVLDLKNECFSTPLLTFFDCLKKIFLYSTASCLEEGRESRGKRCLSSLPSMVYFNL